MTNTLIGKHGASIGDMMNHEFDEVQQVKDFHLPTTNLFNGDVSENGQVRRGKRIFLISLLTLLGIMLVDSVTTAYFVHLFGG